MKVADVNTTSIREAITIGCHAMSDIFNADDNDIPFFGSLVRLDAVRPDAGFSFHPFHSEAHIPGRHLNALLSAENALGLPPLVDEAVIEKHAKAAFFSYSGPVAFPLNREAIGGKLVNFAPHNLREGFHALYALTAYRGSSRAHELAEASIAAIFDLWDPDRGWNRQRLEGALGLRIIDFDSPFIGGIARAIGPLVKYHRVTGSAAALHLATALKDKALGEFFPASGECDLARLGTHTHSITCVLSSLAQLADATRDAALMESVKAFYDNGLRQISSDLGWSPENAGPNANPDRGEANNTGDILETALLLGRWGYTEQYQDAERILRAHLLPSQLRDVSFIREPDNPDGADAKRSVAQRHRGAFGFPAPYGHQPLGIREISFNLDIIGGAVGSLCEAYREVVRFDGQVQRVNLLFDHETEAVKVQSPYANGVLQITAKQTAPLMVRVPRGVPTSDIRVDGATALPRLVNGYLYIAEPPLHSAISVRFPLLRQEIVLHYRTRRIRVQLKGDQVERMENFGQDLTFFDPQPSFLPP